MVSSADYIYKLCTIIIIPHACGALLHIFQKVNVVVLLRLHMSI